MPTLYVYNDGHYNALEKRWQWVDKHDTYTDFIIIPIRSAVVVQREDGGPWMHGTVVEHGTKEYNISLTICVMKTGHIITRTAHHVKLKMIPTEPQLCVEIKKAEKQQQGNYGFDSPVNTYSMPNTNKDYTQTPEEILEYKCRLCQGRRLKCRKMQTCDNAHATGHTPQHSRAALESRQDIIVNFTNALLQARKWQLVVVE